MSATLDANLLLYASDTDSSFHEPAIETLRRLAAGPELLYLFWPVVMSYLRIATHPAVFAEPLDPQQAIGNVDTLLRRALVRAPGEDDGFWSTYQMVQQATVVRGNLVPDAHVVALMRLHGVSTIWTRDRDFRKFDGIRVRDPFAA